MGMMLIAGAIGWWFFVDNDTVSYATSFSNEVAALETELIGLEAEIVAGTLTPQEAGAAQARIEARLEALTDASALAQAEVLTPAERTALLAGLDQLKVILITYQDTLQTVDEQVAALPDAERPTAPTGNGSIRLQVVAAIEVINEQLAAEIAMEETAAAASDSNTEATTTAEVAATTAADNTETVVADVDAATESAATATTEEDVPRTDESSVELEPATATSS